jgi:hypothetical protein
MYTRAKLVVVALALVALAAIACIACFNVTNDASTPQSEEPVSPRLRPVAAAVRAARAAAVTQRAAHASGVTPRQRTLQSTQPSTFDTAESVSGATARLQLVPIDALPARRVSDGPELTAYHNAWPGTDVVRMTERSQLKETILVRRRARSGAFAWTVRGNARLAAAHGGGLRTIVRGVTTALSVPPPVVLDASGNPIHGATARYVLRSGSSRGTQVLRLTWGVPPGTRFPINVDPTFTTGQAASSVLGATSFTDAQTHLGHDAWASGDTYAIAAAGSKLLISEQYGYSSVTSQRIFYFNSMPTGNAQPFDGSFGNNGAGASGFYRPMGVWSDGTRVAVADPNNNRVMLWNTWPATNTTPADVVIGQPTNTSTAANNGGVTASSMRNPERVWFDGTHLIVSDSLNNRVLIWNSWPTTTGQAADVVVGQADMSGNTQNRGGARDAGGFDRPEGVWSDGTSLYVVDRDNSRVLGWTTFPTSDGQLANVTLGQSTFAGGSCNALSGKAGMCSPYGVTGGGGSLYVGDFYNNRVMKWNTLPTTNGQAADIEIGQRAGAGTSATLLRNPMDVAVVGTKLAINDYGNSRILIYDSIPVADGAAADHVVGQVDFTHDGIKGGDSSLLVQPSGVAFDSTGRLYVGNHAASNIMRFPASLPATGATADLGIGQMSLGGRLAPLTQEGPVGNMQISPDGKLLFASQWRARATWWNSVPTTSPVTLSGVVGQPTLGTSGINRGGPAGRDTLGGASDISWDGTHLAVADYANNRILIWNSLPADGAPADVVVGQPDGTSTAPNNGGISSSSLYSPQGVRLWGGKLFVADSSNNRVLIWNSIPTSDGTPADVVLGQPNMSANTATTSATGMNMVQSVDVADGALVVADRDNRRVLVYDTIPTTSGAPADRVIGQASMTTATPSVSQTGFARPYFVALHAGRMAVTDNYQRVLVYEDVLAPTESGITAVEAGERATFTFSTDEDAVTEVIYDTTSHPGGTGYAFSAGPSAAGRSHSIAATGLIPGSTYYYRVVATDSRGNVSQSNEFSFVANNTSVFETAPSVGDDATISESAAADNFGRSETLDIGGAGAGSRHRSLVRFDLSQLPPGAVVTSATLALQATDAGSGTAPSISARSVSTAWMEGVGDGAPQPDGATWTSFDGVDPWSSAGGDAAAPIIGSALAPAAVPGTTAIDVTSAVSAWVTSGDPNMGLLLAPTSEPATDLVRFASGDATDTTLRPRLTVAWQGSDTTNPAISSVRVRNLSSVSMEVSWDTDEASTSTVDYGTTVAYTDGTLSDPNAVNHHVVVLSGLTMNTLYHLRVRSSDAQGNEGASGDNVARTSYRAVIEPDDTFLRSDMPTRNNGAQRSLFVGNAAGTWQQANSLLHFDLSSIPPGANVTSATMQLTASGQAGSTTPTLEAHALSAPFTEGSGNANVGPPLALTSGSVIGEAAFLAPAERHVALTSNGWLSTHFVYDTGNRDLRYRRSQDGISFSGEAVLTTYYGQTGISIQPDASSFWIGTFYYSNSVFDVRRYDDSTSGLLESGSVTFPTGVNNVPSVVLADDGHLWIKGESPSGAVWVSRSDAPRDPSGWSAPVQIASQAAPGHAILVPLAGGTMAALSQDGSMISLRIWDGSSWGAPTLVAADAAPVTTNWIQTENMAAVTDGSGGVWLGYLTAAGDVIAMRYAGAAWGSPDTVQSGGAGAVAITLDAGSGEPHIAWESGTNVMLSVHGGGTWAAAQTLQTGIVAGLTQLTMSPPSDEAIAVSWAQPNGSNALIRWRGYALAKAPDGATWASRDGATAWTTPGGDEDPAPAIATATATNVVGDKVAMDFTSQVTDWMNGAPNNGFVLRKQTDDPGLTDWKAFYSAEAATASLRPRLTVDYDLASVTINQPNASTTWRNGQMAELTWQTGGSGATDVNLSLSDDNGASWTPIVSGIANTGSYLWQVAPVTGLYQVKVEVLVAGNPIAVGTSPNFVVEDIPPSPITTLAVNSPSSAAILTWSAPADTGGAGMANGSYRVYRSASSGSQGTRIATVSALTYTDASALADGPWYYTVIPVDAAGNAQSVGNDQVVTQHDGSAPNPITDLTAPGLTNQPVALSWSAVSDVGPAGTSDYRVYRSTVAGVRGTLLRTIATTSDADTPPSDGTWYYTITPLDAAGNVRLTGNDQVGVVYDSTAPAPVTVTIDGGAAWSGARAVTATISGADAVDVQLSEDPAFAGATWTAIAATLAFQLADADGAHTVYARYRDLAGNISATANDSIGLDRAAPPAVTPIRDGLGAGDLDYQASTTELRAAWTGVSDPLSGLARYDLCFSTATDCGGTVVSAWTSIGTATSATVGSLTLTPGQEYFACVRSVDNVGNVLSPVSCTDGMTVVAIDSVSPGTVPQGRRSFAVAVTGAGFDPATTVSFSGTDVTVTNVTWVDPTRLDLTLDIASSGSPGTRNMTLTSPDGSVVTSTPAIAITAPSITVMIGSLDFDGNSSPLSASGPYALDMGHVLPGTVRELGTATSGQAVPGSAIDLDVESDTDWSVTASASNFSGPAALAASTLEWKHHSVAEAWTQFTTSAADIEDLQSPNTPATTTLSYDLRWSIPAAHAAGAYTTNLSLTAVPAP